MSIKDFVTSTGGLVQVGKAEERLTAKEVAYMELEGAIKDADCHKVYVEGGVSTLLGCCNAFQPATMATQAFRCGLCKFVSVNG